MSRPRSRPRPTLTSRSRLAEIEDAAGRLDGYVHRTPLLSSMTAARWVTRATGDPAGRRPAVSQGRAPPEDRLVQGARHDQPDRDACPTKLAQRGAITLSAGNAGQAYAWAGAAAGVPVTVVMPEGAVRSKVEACLGYGARVVLHGTHVGDTFAEMERIRDAEGLTFVHPFDDPAVIAGNGTVGLELVDDMPDVDVVVVGVGGGGLISGIASAVKARRPSARVVGVEPERSNAVSLALERNEIVTIQPTSRRGRARRALRRALDAGHHPAAGRRDRPARRPDDPGRAALRAGAAQAGRRTGRGGGAGCRPGRSGAAEDGERVAVVLSGGNVEMSRLGRAAGCRGDAARSAAASRRRGRAAGRRRCRGGGRARG